MGPEAFKRDSRDPEGYILIYNLNSLGGAI